MATSLKDKWIKQPETTGSFREIDNHGDIEQELIKLCKRTKQLEMDFNI